MSGPRQEISTAKALREKKLVRQVFYADCLYGSAAHAIVRGCPASPWGLSILLREENAYIVEKTLRISFISYTAAIFITV
jgi:hypothetical protein